MIDTEVSVLYDELTTASQEVDLDDVRDAAGYATLIFAVANGLGILLPTGNRQTPEAITTARLAREWVAGIKARIAGMTAGDAMELLEPFDFMHRVGHRSPTPRAFVDEYLMKAFEARIRGDKTVNEYHLFRLIKSELERNNKPFFGRPLKWYCSVLDHWHRKFSRGWASEDLPDYDTLETVSILMRENLFAFEGSNETAFKKRLFDNHRHYLDEIDRLDTDTLPALSRFLTQSIPYLSDPDCNGPKFNREVSGNNREMPCERYETLDEAIHSAQLSAPSTNRFYRLSLAHNRMILELMA